jgi:putative drug exporter of the RND superfamily
MTDLFHQLGRFVGAHPRRVLICWAAAIALGVWGGTKFPDAALGGSLGLYGSPSKAVSDALRNEFDNSLLDPLIAVAASPALSVDSQAFLDWDRDAARALRAMHEVKAVADYASLHDPHLRSATGHETILLIGLSATDMRARQHAVPRVRAALAPLRLQLARLDPDSRIAVTGDAAVDYDINTASAEGGDRAEKRALPLTLLILVLAFGTLIAAGLPFLMGLATTMVSLGLAFLLAHAMPVSNLLGNVVTMIGLAVGIDYSLLMVKDYRERLKTAEPREAVAATVAEAGVTIAWSGSTVTVGLLGLLFSPVLETRSVGIGGALVVAVSVLAALTLLPACLALLGRHIERWPVIPAALRGGGSGSVWRPLAAWTVRRPALSLGLAGSVVIALALPVFAAHSGFTTEAWFLPRGMESRTGNELLSRLGYDNAGLAVRVLLRSTDAQAILASAHQRALKDYTDRLRLDARVAAVLPPYPSRDGLAALIEVIPAAGLHIETIQALARDLGAIRPGGPFSATIGGTPAYDNDFTDYMWQSFPKVFGFIVATTLLLLFVAFRSYLLPLKAVAANMLAIAAGYGVVVAVCQFGWLHSLVGLERPFSSIALEIPLMIFCLSFGLSMDYELFLLFRIRREYLAHADNDRATVAGLAGVAPVITGAGLIMAAVFGAFAAADLPALKMIGLGLCVAVFIDATVIRGFIVPAIMSIAGRWNWYPGI